MLDMVLRPHQRRGHPIADELPFVPATGINNYLRNGGTMEKAQRMAAHESARTTGLYDPRTDELAEQGIEKVRFDVVDPA